MCLSAQFETVPVFYFLSWKEAEKAMATHSSVLAWRIPGTREPGGLPSMGSHRVGHKWSDLAAAAAAWKEDLMEQKTSQWDWFQKGSYYIYSQIIFIHYLDKHGTLWGHLHLLIKHKWKWNSPRNTDIHILKDIQNACSVAQLCLTLCNPMDCSPPGSSVYGILQARIL